MFPFKTVEYVDLRCSEFKKIYPALINLYNRRFLILVNDTNSTNVIQKHIIFINH